MGIAPLWFDFFFDLCREGYLKRGDAILDIGASELFCADDPDVLNRFLRFFDAPLYDEKELAFMADRAFAADLFRRAGFRYTAIDYAKFPGVVRLDLNFRGLPWRHRGRYQFVANTGTSEHILNQFNVFKVIHDAAAPNAIMYHSVPGWGDYEHGIFEYSPKFFWQLAAANDYKILKFWGHAKGKVAPLKEIFAKQIAFDRLPECNRAIIKILMQKQHRAGFKALNDPAFSPDLAVPARN
jgi:hypothetical protein